MPDNNHDGHCPTCGHCPSACWTRANAQHKERAIRRQPEDDEARQNAASETDD